MNLSQILEARYHKHPAVDMIKRARETKEHLDHRFPLEEIERVVSELSAEFGPPQHHNREWYTGGSHERWIWEDFVVIRYGDFGFIENSKLYR